LALHLGAKIDSDALTAALDSRDRYIINKVIESFNAHNSIYNNIDQVIKKSDSEFIDIINNLEIGTWKYSNFQHLIVYGNINSNKE
jgi:hypothetical protein